jgi:hypothetical protein
MKVLALTLALVGLASTAPLNAQILSRGPVTSTTTANGSWVYVGRDGSGYQIYERRVQDSYGNIVVQRARRNSNGSMSIISTNTVSNGNNGNNRNNRNNDCTYSRSTNSVGDIIFGRSGSNTTNCVDNSNNRVSGGWYQVGSDNGGTIYERQTRDSNGNLIIQRARRDRNGRMSIISTRNAGNNGSYNNGSYNNGSYDNGRGDNNNQGDNENRRSKNKDKHRGNGNNGNNGNHDNNDNNDNN